VGFLNFAWNVDLRVIFYTCRVRADIVCVREAEILKVTLHILSTLFEVLSSPYSQGYHRNY